MTMPRVAFPTAALLLGGGLLWAVRISFGPTFMTQGAATLLAADIVILTAIAVVAMLLAPGRWVRIFITSLAGGWAAVAIALPADPLWVAAVGCSLAGVALAWLGPMDDWFVGGVKPDRVPVRATVLSLGLLAVPGLVALTASGGVTASGWFLAGLSLVGGWAYARAIPLSVWVLRIALPVSGGWSVMGLVVGDGLARGALVTGLVALAWTADARLAASPLVSRKVDTVPILPEMVPTDLMESAGYDRRGRPKEVD